jgi:hypothetical protein
LSAASRARALVCLSRRAFSVNTKPKPKEETMPVEEAIKLCVAMSRAKFNESVEVRNTVLHEWFMCSLCLTYVLLWYTTLPGWLQSGR